MILDKFGNKGLKFEITFLHPSNGLLLAKRLGRMLQDFDDRSTRILKVGVLSDQANLDGI